MPRLETKCLDCGKVLSASDVGLEPHNVVDCIEHRFFDGAQPMVTDPYAVSLMGALRMLIDAWPAPRPTR